MWAKKTLLFPATTKNLRLKINQHAKNQPFLFLSTEKRNQSGVPDKYFVITNNEIVRVRYLIVYGSEMKTGGNSNLAQCGNFTQNTLLKWIHRHKWMAAMITYAAVLLIIGASNSRHGYYMRQYMRQATINAINYLKTFNLFGFNYIQKLFR